MGFEEKNKKIAMTKRETIERHSNMVCKTFEVKIQDNQLSKKQRESLFMMFIEQKWYKNYILSLNEQNKENKISKFDTRITHITHKDKDLNDVEVEIKYLPATSRQCLISRMIANMKSVSTLTKNGYQKGGKQRYSKQETVIDYKQYGTTHKIVSKNSVKLQGVKGKIKVNGLSQFINIEGIEYANARLIHRPTGYYVQFVCYVPKKETKKTNGKVIGIDFGCSTSFTTSEGEKIDVKIQEDEQLKRLQRKLKHQQKGSKGYNKTVEKIHKKYQKIKNQKDDLANKVCAHFDEYETIVIQDEQLQNWHKGNHGRAVQHSVLGRVKSKLKQNPKTVVLNKWVFTSKMCNCCGAINDNLKLWDREFVCEDCGYSEDRDVNASKNMVWFFNNNVGMGRTKIKRVEMEALVYSKFHGIDSNSKSMKPEATTL